LSDNIVFLQLPSGYNKKISKLPSSLKVLYYDDLLVDVKTAFGSVIAMEV